MTDFAFLQNVTSLGIVAWERIARIAATAAQVTGVWRTAPLVARIG